MNQVRLERPGIDAVIGELQTGGMSQHVCVRLDAKFSGLRAARSIIREKPGADNGAPRSDTNAKGDFSLSFDHHECCKATGSGRSSPSINAPCPRSVF